MIGKRPIESIRNFSAVGFDLDHTFLRYRMRSFLKLIYEAAATYLVANKGYPSEVFPRDEEDAKQKFRMFFRAILDHRSGNLLKVDSNCSVMRAFHGFRCLQPRELRETYGSFQKIDPRVFDVYRGRDWTYFHDFYGAGVVPLIAQLTHLKNQNHFPGLRAKSYSDLVHDIFEGCNWNYTITDFPRFERGEFQGFWYPRLMTDPLHYVNRTSPELLQRLARLREAGKKVFIVSNNYFAPSSNMLNASIGPDWLDHFDFVIFEAEKPGFFHDLKAGKMPCRTLQGVDVPDLDTYLAQNPQGRAKVLVGGSAAQLSGHFQRQFGENYQVAFFGDSIFSDCVYSFNSTLNPNWMVCLILEELQELEHGYPDKEYFNYCSYWGSALHDKSFLSGVDKTYIFHVADKVAHRSFSALESKEALDFLTI